MWVLFLSAKHSTKEKHNVDRHALNLALICQCLFGSENWSCAFVFGFFNSRLQLYHLHTLHEQYRILPYIGFNKRDLKYFWLYYLEWKTYNNNESLNWHENILRWNKHTLMYLFHILYMFCVRVQKGCV